MLKRNQIGQFLQLDEKQREIFVLVRIILTIEKFKDSPCWLWQSKKNMHGYGVMTIKKKDIRIHRYTYQQYIGDIPKGLELDHLCRIRHCVNPYHLEPVTHRENLLRGTSVSAINARKTHCKMGHEFTAENILNTTRNTRICRMCNRVQCQLRYKKKMEVMN